MNTFQYNSSAVNYYTTEDLGSIEDTPTSTVDSGTVSVAYNTSNTYGEVVYTETVYPYGTIKISSNTSSSASVKFVSAGTIKLDSAYVVKFRSVWIGSGSLFEIAGGKERIVAPWIGSSGPLRITGSSTSLCTYEYNDSAVVEYSSDDFGGVSSTITSSIDYGVVTSSASAEENLGAIFLSNTVQPYGSINIVGESSIIYKPSFAWRGSGSLFGISNTAESVLFNYKSDISLLKFSNIEKNSVTKPYIGFGGLFSIGDRVERASYSYNQSSINLYDPEQDYGSIVASGNTIDFGYVTAATTQGEIDYGLINVSDIDYPLNVLFKISGESVNSYKPSFTWKGSGSLFAVSNTAESATFSYVRTVLFNLSGGERDAFSRPYIGSGGLFNIGDKIEKATYNYNQSSINLYAPEQDYGSITSSGTTIDLGYVNNLTSGGEIDYGLINVSDIDYPLNVLFSFSGEALSDYKPVFTQIGSGGFNFYHQPKPTDTRFIPWWRGRGGASIFNSIIPDAFSRPYIGSGNLFSFGDKVESATYDYNTSSVEFFTTEDYGTIASSGTTIDYGYVSEPNVGVTDYSSIVNLDVDYPLNVLYRFTGEGEGQFIRGPYSGKGNVSINGVAIEKQTDDWSGTAFVYVSGTATEKNTESYVGSGSLFHIGDRVEKATYSYNSSSIYGYSETNYGFITASGNTLDYGYVYESAAGGEVDLGNVIDLDITYPFGLFKIAGQSADKWIQVFTKVGSGSLFEFNGATEAFSAQTPENTFLYTFSGTGNDSKTNTFIGQGSLFGIGDRVERATYSYNESSIVSYEPELDYGSITASGTTVDYGYVNQIATEGEIDYGSIVLYEYEYPVNVLFKFTGESITELKPSFNFKGSGKINIESDLTFVRFRPWWRSVGGLFVDGTSNESSTRPYIGSGSLFHIGDRVERATYSYNSSSVYGYDETDYGFITSSGFTINYGYVYESAAGGEVDLGNVIDLDITYPYGLFSISGSSTDRWIQVFTKVGSGSLFEFNGATEAFSAQTPENTFLYTISGDANESRTRPYIGSGSLFHIGDRVERATFSYNTSSVVDPTTSVDYGILDNVTGTIDYGSIVDVVDSGEIDNGSIATVPGFETPFGLFSIYGRAVTPFERSYEGSGSFFAISNTAEAFSAQTPENTFLYTFSGSAGTPRTRPFIGSGDATTITGYITEKHTESYRGFVQFAFEERFPAASVVNTESYVGSGTITLSTGRFPEFRNYRPTPRYVNSVYGEIGGQFAISGNATTKPIAVFTKIGSGTEYISGSKVEKQTDSWKGTGKIDLQGNAGTDRARSYVGTGFFSVLKGGAESFSAQTPENTFLYRISGSATEKNTERFIGSGSVFSVGSATETILISAATRTVLFNVSGSAVPVVTLSHYGSGSLFTYRESTSSVTFNPVENRILYQISGSASLRRSDKYDASGAINLAGSLIEKNTESYRGSGNLYTIGSTSASTTFNPVENTALFNISGSAIEKHTERYVGSGDLFSFGKSDTRVTFNPVEEATTFVVSGNADFTKTKKFVGSGSLFAFNGSSETISYAGTQNIILYRISGAATVKHVERYIGSGTEFISGSATEKHTETFIGTGSIFTFGSKVEVKAVSETGTGNISIFGYISEVYAKAPYVGSGSLFAFKGATESKVSNPPEETVLFRFTGSATEKHTESYKGKGSAYISGSAIEKHTEKYVGTGRISIANSAAVSFIAQTPEETILYRISGAATFKFIPRYVGSGSETLSGSLVERQTDSYRGSGSLFGIGNTSYSILITEQTDTSTSLFKIFGTSPNRYTKISVTNTFNIEISGASRDVVVLFTPARIFGTII